MDMQSTSSNDANAYGYPPRIWQLFQQAPRAGRFEPGTPGVVAGKAGTPAARSVLSLEMRFEQGRVIDARFRAYGCPSSIAVGAWIAQWSQGREPAELAALSAAHLRAELEIPEDRAHCALMGEDALRDLLANIKT
ncbi:MAG: aminotransferase class V-fold PLP-dependent enzyme [Hydrocarboniphaga sp.]|uniref:iron-sulfur cluster assembly scaffold protein n=1 Tax=Hydrocarboniphaga sp. TaxID=2033016 RepID=UPI002629A4B4|nr:iron-sulfur cluster assembly scaffold protein [Hydrocarboniphaga sp.]MDB5968170.1 aminotransferase class V-fold PLP-dependent enzyme [Hydrocarboniphaga sp.]